MTESRPAKKPTPTSVRRPVGPKAKGKGPEASPSWYAPLMVGLMLVGLLWIVTFYLSQGRFPVQAWGQWNLGAGAGLALAGFLMMTNWR